MAQARKISQTFDGLNPWIIGGSYFKLLSTVNSVDVKLYLAGQVVVDASQVDQGFYSREAFDRIEITTGANELVAFIVADKEAGSDQFTGSVNSTIVGPFVADNADAQAPVGAAGILPVLARQQIWNGARWDRYQRLSSPGSYAGLDQQVDSGVAYLGDIVQAAVAGNFSFCQLFNPVGSGKTLFLDALTGALASANSSPIYWDNVARGTVGGAANNKNFGTITANAGQLRSASVATYIGGGVITRAYPESGNKFVVPIRQPLQIPAGFGVTIFSPLVNQILAVDFEWREY